MPMRRSRARRNGRDRRPTSFRNKRVSAGLALSWYERLKERPAVDISYYRIGPARILHLPGEPFVEYQLYAQSLHANDFVAVAGYGEGGMGYICMDKQRSAGQLLSDGPVNQITDGRDGGRRCCLENLSL
jgi:hypothetical protein